MADNKLKKNIYKFRYFYVFSIIYTTFCFIIFIGLSALRISETQSEFNIKVNEEVRKMQIQMDTYNNVLFTLRSILTTDKQLSVAEWNNYIKSMVLPERYPDILAAGYLHRVDPEAMSSYQLQLNSMYSKYATPHQIYPTDIYPENFVFTYIYPDTNKGTVGLNPSGNIERFQAITNAIRTGNTTATPRVALLDPSISTEQSLIIYLPVYKYLKPVGTEEERIANAQGVIALTFPVKRMIQTYYTDYKVGDNIQLEIEDITEPNNPYTIYSSVDLHKSPTDFKHSVNVLFSQRNWRFTFYAPLGYELRTGGVFTFVIVVVLLILFGLTASFFILQQIKRQK